MSFSEPAKVKISSNANSVIDIYFHLQLALTCLTMHEMLSKTKRMMHFSSWIWFYHNLYWTLKMSFSEPAEVKISSNANSVSQKNVRLHALVIISVLFFSVWHLVLSSKIHTYPGLKLEMPAVKLLMM